MSGAPAALELPLAGGRDGATVRLHPLLTGELLAPPGLLASSGGPLGGLRALGVGVPKSSWTWIPAPAFLIEHPGAGFLLVDTGLHPDAPLRPRAVMGPVSSFLYEFRIEPGRGLPDQLRAHGVDAGSLAAVLMTHLHSDHASGLSEVPPAPIVVDRREWQAARAPTAVSRGYSRIHLAQGMDFHVVDHRESDILHDPFESAIDLLGDGSVRLVSTPGHTPGHQSVLVRLRDREMLIAGDAAYTMETIREGAMPGIVADREAFARSLERIRAFVEADADALVVPGHDARAWRELDRRYE